MRPGRAVHDALHVVSATTRLQAEAGSPSWREGKRSQQMKEIPCAFLLGMRFGFGACPCDAMRISSSVWLGPRPPARVLQQKSPARLLPATNRRLKNDHACSTRSEPSPFHHPICHPTPVKSRHIIWKTRKHVQDWLQTCLRLVFFCILLL